ncbi:ATP-dependent helicase HrpB [Rhizobium halophytocola]|uniref:ATP-dependent helicase HrpB n=1 Tax=Rhizobium halophytocola TaxID=735519 RepID=A0ABS4E1G4_9HYPH|nr:ATP-dependent helicase HrpB [Rhizobium halophytocola]MBP1851798.1 ATP-dependent helicase HrpB [Rhizobium halophytocola]
MSASLPTLPVSAVLDDLETALTAGPRAILCAPPGAGKTTLVPLRLLDAPWRAGRRILLLEPRRLAARAAARRMAQLIGESVGETVGYRMRLDTRISARTAIEVVTEGVFTRMILDDPELADIAAVIFDEFHERSLDADLGLALALDVQSALRPDLRILVMSATLDTARIADLMDRPPVIESQGRSFPVEIRHQPRSGGSRIEDAMIETVTRCYRTEPGSILAFLPGQAEIRRVAASLAETLPGDALIAPLYGNLDQAEQDAAIRLAAPGRRKIVLATSIAETSITIDGVRIVIDSGLQRLPVFEPATGITRLETVKVSRASADQRAGRAGRTEPGIAIRLWNEGQTAAMPAFTPPEILATDLSAFLLDLAHWGVQDPATLSFIDLPPAAALAEARQLLARLGALDTKGLLTPKGRLMRDLGLEPRLAAMAIAAATLGQGEPACRLAVLLGEQGLGGPSIDLEDRLRRFSTDRSERATKARQLAAQLAKRLGPRNGDPAARQEVLTAGQLLMFAFPDRIAAARGARGRFVLANGRGGELDETERLAAARMLVVADLTGRAGRQRILAAAELERGDVEALMPELVGQKDEVYFDLASRQVRARRVTRLGAILLDEAPRGAPTGAAVAEGLADGVRQLGLDVLPFAKAARQLRQRIGFLHRTLGDPWPDMSEEALLARLDDWFVPFQGSARSLETIDPSSLHAGLLSLVPHALQRELDVLTPSHFTAPTGQAHPIRYDAEEPVISVRVQELYGLKTHPTIGGGALPLVLELTSPAHRPIQTTRDLPGFWAGSWRDVRADMRGRYPKHEWPERPADAMPTTRAKPRSK